MHGIKCTWRIGPRILAPSKISPSIHGNTTCGLHKAMHAVAKAIAIYLSLCDQREWAWQAIILALLYKLHGHIHNSCSVLQDFCSYTLHTVVNKLSSATHPISTSLLTLCGKPVPHEWICTNWELRMVMPRVPCRLAISLVGPCSPLICSTECIASPKSVPPINKVSP